MLTLVAIVIWLIRVIQFDNLVGYFFFDPYYPNFLGREPQPDLTLWLCLDSIFFFDPYHPNFLGGEPESVEWIYSWWNLVKCRVSSLYLTKLFTFSRSISNGMFVPEQKLVSSPKSSSSISFSSTSSSSSSSGILVTLLKSIGLSIVTMFSDWLIAWDFSSFRLGLLVVPRHGVFADVT